MKQANALFQLKQIAEAQYLREFQKIQAALEAEAQAQRRLQQLDDQTVQANQSLETGNALAHIGADVAWQKWAAQTREQLMHKLAHARARRLQEMDRVRVAFGRKEALQTLDKSARQAAAVQRRRKMQETLLSGALK